MFKIEIMNKSVNVKNHDNTIIMSYIFMIGAREENYLLCTFLIISFCKCAVKCILNVSKINDC